MSDRPPITGAVAKILNSRDLVINRGTEDGVAEGMRFIVLDPNAENIKDPDTGETLGSIDRPKIEVEVFSAEEKLSLAHTFRKIRRNVGGSGLFTAKALQPPKYITRYETLKTDESTWESLDETESLVKTGDPVKEITADQKYPHAGTEVEE